MTIVINMVSKLTDTYWELPTRSLNYRLRRWKVTDIKVIKAHTEIITTRFTTRDELYKHIDKLNTKVLKELFESLY